MASVIWKMGFISSIPSAPGSIRSSRMRSGFSTSMRRSASSGSPVTMGVYPASDSVFRTSRSICGSSSTARTRARPLAIGPGLGAEPLAAS